MGTSYLALIRKEEDSSFGVEFPDLPGCISAGDTVDEAVESATEALDLHVRGMLEDGDPIPKPRAFADILHELEAAGDDDVRNRRVLVREIALPEPKARSLRVNITLDEVLLRRIDEKANAEGMTRSAFLAEAARRRIG